MLVVMKKTTKKAKKVQRACSNCGVLGHNIRTCAVKKASKKGKR